MKLEKLGSLPQVVVLFVCPPPPTRIRTHNEYICENFKQDIRVSNTSFSRNQAWKRDFKHSSIFSSHKKHIFIHICYIAKRTQLRSTQVVMGTCNVHHITNCTCHGPLNQMINGFFIKSKLIVFYKLSNIQCTLKNLFLPL
jgi:hypothetical protein